MSVDLNVPDWLREQCHTWIERLDMREWNVTLRLELAPNDESFVDGLTTQVPHLNLGRIALRADIEQTEWWEIVLVHELLHVKHSRIDTVVSTAIIPATRDVTMAETSYRLVVEPFIHSMAEVLVKAYRVEPQVVEEAEGADESQ